MTEDDLVFDPSMKKKKKKKKMPSDLEAVLAGGEEPAEPAESTADTASTEPAETPAPEQSKPTEDISLDDDFSLLKKKKKKKKAFDLSELDENLPTSDAAKDTDEAPRPAATTATPASDLVTDDLDFSLPSKKKKKKKTKILDEDAVDGEKLDDGEDGGVRVDATTWSATERDYTYEELLKRAIDIMREKNPDLVAGEKKRFIMKPPQVMRVGTKKSSFSNFTDICKLLHRQPKHLLAFLLAELGTSGSIDGNNQLIIKGRFQQKQIETVLRAYIKEYVTCHTCRSPDTILQKDVRLYFLQCETCSSRCSVASIKSGFQAITGKRAAARAKTA